MQSTGRQAAWQLQADLWSSCAAGAAASLRGKGRRPPSATSDQCLPGVLRPWGLWLHCTHSSCHFSLEGIPLWGEGGDPNQKEENRCPQKEPVWAARSQRVSGHPYLPKALSRSQSRRSPPFALWAAGLTLLPIVYSVIHRNSRTTVLFPPLSYSRLLPHPQPSPALKLTSWRLCLRKEFKRLGVWPGRWEGGAGQSGRRTFSAHQVWAAAQLPPRLCSLHPQRAVGCRLPPPSLLWSYTVARKLWGICSLLSLRVGALSFLDQRTLFSRQS